MKSAIFWCHRNVKLENRSSAIIPKFPTCNFRVRCRSVHFWWLCDRFSWLPCVPGVNFWYVLCKFCCGQWRTTVPSPTLRFRHRNRPHFSTTESLFCYFLCISVHKINSFALAVFVHKVNKVLMTYEATHTHNNNVYGNTHKSVYIAVNAAWLWGGRRHTHTHTH